VRKHVRMTIAVLLGVVFAAIKTIHPGVASWLLESVVLELPGGIVGGLLVTGLWYSLILGIVGGLLPGIRAARVPVTTGLREL
jgi:hypothetical protein